MPEIIDLSLKKRRSKTFFSIFMTALCTCFVIPSAICAILLVTSPSIPRGEVMVGNSDMVLISIFDSSIINEVYFSADDAVEVNFYQDICSDIGPFQQLHNSTLQLNISDSMQYQIDEVYLLKGSEAIYSMSSKSESQILPCSAKVHVFTRRNKYQQFLLNGDVSKLASSYCINSTKVLDLNIFSHRHQYFFIGLESLSSATLDYTVIKNVLKYNITNSTRSPTSCVFSISSPLCSISLDNYPDSQEVCVLASLQESNFITLNYATVSYRSNMQVIAAILVLFIPYLVILIILCCFLAIFYYLKKK